MTFDQLGQQQAATQQGIGQQQQFQQQGLMGNVLGNAIGVSTVSGTSQTFTVPTTFTNAGQQFTHYTPTPYTLDSQIKDLAMMIHGLAEELRKVRKELAKLSLDRESGHKSVDDIMRQMDVYVS